MEALWGNHDAGQQLLSYLAARDVANLAATCTQWASACRSPRLWKRELERELRAPASRSGVNYDTSYMDLVRWRAC